MYTLREEAVMREGEELLLAESTLPVLLSGCGGCSAARSAGAGAGAGAG